MFGFFSAKNKLEDSKAYLLGKQASQNMTADLDDFIERRFRPVFKNYLDVLQERLNSAINPSDGPPLTVARIEYNLFTKNIDELVDQMTGEINIQMKKWLEFDKETLGVGGLPQLISKRVNQFQDELKSAGLIRLLDMAEAFKKADKNWRSDNPIKATEFPLG